MRARTLVCGCYCIRTTYTGLALPTTSIGHSFELKAYLGFADNPGLVHANTKIQNSSHAGAQSTRGLLNGSRLGSRAI